MEAGLMLLAGVVLLVAGIGGALSRNRLAGLVVQRLGPSPGGQPRNAGSIAMIILVIGVVVAFWGASLIVWGWLETDFIQVPEGASG
ncbi:hypothetical protein ACH3VR_10855 [Microbacterium sp. B2969]|uniref:Uncharacterized protein n=1 Tax=Microbacterium alkaliflavum TaxID=3248839 RepID=A0ABW7Q7K8_9MICO